jgi:hypothetical protein
MRSECEPLFDNAATFHDENAICSAHGGEPMSNHNRSALAYQLDPVQLDKVMTEGEAEVSIAKRPFVPRGSVVEEMGEHDIPARVTDLRRPLLVMHAPNDSVVGIERASPIFMAARHPKSFISLDSADHHRASVGQG